jgi:hypothetical protein
MGAVSGALTQARILDTLGLHSQPPSASADGKRARVVVSSSSDAGPLPQPQTQQRHRIMVDLDRRSHSQMDVQFDAERRYDILITSPNATSYRLSPAAARAIILNLKTKYWIRPYEEAIAEEWAEVYSQSYPTSHEMFTQGVFPADLPVFLEVAIYFGQQAVDLEYGPKQAYFYIEIRGCLFKEPLGIVKKLIKDILNIRAEVACRPHVALPPHRVVPVVETDVYDREP